MGRIAPWVKYYTEWNDIRDERKKGGLGKRERRDETEFMAGSAAGVESRQHWIVERVSARLGLSTPKFYSDQRQCLLLRLPLELRHTIWGHVIGGHIVRIVRKENKLAHLVLPLDEARLEAWERTKERSRYYGPGNEKRISAKEVLADVNLLTLLHVCKWT